MLLYLQLRYKFTFHHVSIKTNRSYFPERVSKMHSHSTMYLLKRIGKIRGKFADAHSHSTMYLLKLFVVFDNPKSNFQFTFHHVSIKTKAEWYESKLIEYSHSTMYLLKH